MQQALRSKENTKEAALAYFSYCPFCGSDYSMNQEESLNERHILCRNCQRKWKVNRTLGAIWFTRTNDLKQKKKYTSSWIVKRCDRSLEGIRPYLLLETDYQIGKQKAIEQGLDRFVWKDASLLRHFDKYDELAKGGSCERVKIAFACARTKTKEEKEATSVSGLSTRQVAAVTDLSEQEAWNCMQRLLDEGLIYYEVRPQKGSAGIEALIVGFLGEPIYQMNEYTALKTIKKLIR